MTLIVIIFILCIIIHFQVISFVYIYTCTWYFYNLYIYRICIWCHRYRSAEEWSYGPSDLRGRVSKRFQNSPRRRESDVYYVVRQWWSVSITRYPRAKFVELTTTRAQPVFDHTYLQSLKTRRVSIRFFSPLNILTVYILWRFRLTILGCVYTTPYILPAMRDKNRISVWITTEPKSYKTRIIDNNN